MITLRDITLQRGSLRLLEHANLTIFPGRRIGVIGQNGCGKSSLFRLLLGELEVDAGDVSIPPAWRIAHMAQEVSASDRAALDYVLDGDRELRAVEAAIVVAEAADDGERLAHLHAALETLHGYDAHYRAAQLLHGLGFTQDQVQTPVSSFSGGWRIRLNLAQALMSPSDLLLLDEPTNHLDLDATLWLEQWLKSYPGTLLLISHDRDFLDNVVDEIVHIENQQCVSYRGNYSAFEVQRAARLMEQQANYEKQQQRIAEIQQFVARFKAKASKAKQAQSRVKELERMEKIAPAHVDSPFHFEFRDAGRMSSPLVNLTDAMIGYGEHSVLQNVNISLQPGSRIGLLGPNGAGKSTLVKTLVGDIPLLGGSRVCGEHLRIGYFAQHQLEALDVQASALTHIQRLSPAVTEQAIRDFLGGFNFHGDKALAPITPFSGGEKARLALAMVVWQCPNLLLLDEPTNHLDLEMRQALAEALQGYSGALVVISHDRYLLRNTVDEFWRVYAGTVQPFDGTLEDYHQWLQQEYSAATADTAPVATVNNDRKTQRQQAAAIRQQLAPLKNRIRDIEKSLEKNQQSLLGIEAELADPVVYDAVNKSRLQVLLQQQRELKRLVEDNETLWLNLNEELEKMGSE